MLRSYLKIAKKCYLLLRDLGLKNSFKYLLARFILRKESVNLETRIGNVLLRTNYSDIRVYFGCALDEYPLLKEKVPDTICFYDFGGYTGLSALSALKYLDIEKVIVFEPVLENYLFAKENLKSKGNVELHNYGLGQKSESVTVNAELGNDWGWSMFNAPGPNGAKGFAEVTLKTLPEIKFDRSKKNFIKFDIEGAEVFLLQKDNSRVLKKFNYIFIEFHESRVPGITDKINSLLMATHKVEKMSSEKILFTRKI